MPISTIILCLMFFLALGGVAIAQDSGYVPPPMFEDDQVRPESTTGNIVEPRASSKTEADKPIFPPDAPKAAVAPQVPKFMQPIVEDKPVKPDKKSPVVDAPKKTVVEKAGKVEKLVPGVSGATIPTPPKKPVPPATSAKKPDGEISVPVAVEKKPSPARKVTSKGVVTGPKTMPAVPTQTVEQQVLDLTAPIAGAHQIPSGPEESPPDETIMERHQQQVQEKQKKEEVRSDVDEDIAAAMSGGVTPAEFESDKAQKVLKKILPFQPGQIDLAEADLLAIGAGIMKELDKRDHWRIQIRAFASPEGNGINSDKRISLSRAIALRKSLVKQGVRPSRIDVRAEGNMPAPVGESSDRVDIYLYSPVEKPEIF